MNDATPLSLSVDEYINGFSPAGSKGNLQFPLGEPLPHALIARVVKARLAENEARKAAKSAEPRARAKRRDG